MEHSSIIQSLFDISPELKNSVINMKVLPAKVNKQQLFAFQFILSSYRENIYDQNILLQLFNKIKLFDSFDSQVEYFSEFNDHIADYKTELKNFNNTFKTTIKNQNKKTKKSTPKKKNNTLSTLVNELVDLAQNTEVIPTVEKKEKKPAAAKKTKKNNDEAEAIESEPKVEEEKPKKEKKPATAKKTKEVVEQPPQPSAEAKEAAEEKPKKEKKPAAAKKTKEAVAEEVKAEENTSAESDVKSEEKPKKEKKTAAAKKTKEVVSEEVKAEEKSLEEAPTEVKAEEKPKKEKKSTAAKKTKEAVAEEVKPNDDEEDVEVRKFRYNDMEYLIDNDNIIYDINEPHPELGYLDNEGIVTFLKK